MYKKILVPYDNSEPSRHALEAALDMASGVNDAEITVLNVVDWHDYNSETFKIASRMAGVAGGALDMNAISAIGDEAETEEQTRIREEIADIVADNGSVKIEVANGNPHDTIVAYANDMGIECIVMGHRGMGMIRGMLGSVCYSVLQKASVPVLITK